jgi:hypothetical protein
MGNDPELLSPERKRFKSQRPIQDLKQNSTHFSFLEISDKEGHYDIDGVSFEKRIGVIVGSDATKKTPRLRK